MDADVYFLLRMGFVYSRLCSWIFLFDWLRYYELRPGSRIGWLDDRCPAASIDWRYFTGIRWAAVVPPPPRLLRFCRLRWAFPPKMLAILEFEELLSGINNLSITLPLLPPPAFGLQLFGMAALYRRAGRMGELMVCIEWGAMFEYCIMEGCKLGKLLDGPSRFRCDLTWCLLPSFSFCGVVYDSCLNPCESMFAPAGWFSLTYCFDTIDPF